MEAASGVLLRSIEEPPGYGRVLDLCDDNDAAEVLDDGDLAVERANLGLSCNSALVDEPRYAVVHMSGAIRIFKKLDVDSRGTASLLAEADDHAPSYALGSFASSEYRDPETVANDVQVLTGSLTLSGIVLRGLILNSSGQYARQLAITAKNSANAVLGLETVPITLQTGEVLPFEMSLTQPASLSDLVVSTTSVRSDAPDLDRAISITGIPGWWSGPPSEFPGLSALASQLPAGPEVKYFETMLEAVAPLNVSPELGATVQIQQPRARVAFLSQGRVVDVVEPQIYADVTSSNPASNWSPGGFGSIGLFPPSDTDAIVMLAWDGG